MFLTVRCLSKEDINSTRVTPQIWVLLSTTFIPSKRSAIYLVVSFYTQPLLCRQRFCPFSQDLSKSFQPALEILLYIYSWHTAKWRPWQIKSIFVLYDLTLIFSRNRIRGRNIIGLRASEISFLQSIWHNVYLFKRFTFVFLFPFQNH